MTSGSWPVSITRDATHEKIAPALNLQRPNVLVATGGYIGDAPPYQGHVVAIDRDDGRLVARLQLALLGPPRDHHAVELCPRPDSAIWGRAGAVVDPATGRVYVATGNAPFDGTTNWGDSVLELTPGVEGPAPPLHPDQPGGARGRPTSTSALTSPGPAAGGRRSAPTFLLQGGKDGKLRLLSLRKSLFGVTGAAGKRLGGQVQTLPTPGDSLMFTAPAVRHRKGTTVTYVATDARHGRVPPEGRAAAPGLGQRHGGHEPDHRRRAALGLRPDRRPQRLPAVERQARPLAPGPVGPLEQPDRRRRPRLPPERRREQPRHARAR